MFVAVCGRLSVGHRVLVLGTHGDVSGVANGCQVERCAAPGVGKEVFCGGRLWGTSDNRRRDERDPRGQMATKGCFRTLDARHCHDGLQAPCRRARWLWA